MMQEVNVKDVISMNVFQKKSIHERQIPDLAWRTLDSVADAIVTLNSEYRICYLNSAAEKLLDVPFVNAIDKEWFEVLEIYDEDKLVDVVAEYEVLPRGNLPDSNVWYLLKRKDGRKIPVRLSIANIYDTDGIHHVGLSIVIHNVECIRKFFDHLIHQSKHDVLTGVVNRSELEKRINRLLNRAGDVRESHALLFMDLDGFKRVNDEHGHQAGDDILRHVAKLFNTIVRERDTIARYGGDEFVLLLEHCSVRNAVNTARMLRVMLKEYTPTLQNKTIDIDVSIGIVGFDQSERDLRSIVAKADEACYKAKRYEGEKVLVA
jgi:diguanylate cyclase (GGDEF)-like protein/PAS domain S-box-containing protein